MEHFVTIFNKDFLPQGMALHQSLMEKCGKAWLWVLAVDLSTKTILEAEKLKNTTVLLLEDFETRELIEVKQTRSLGEYCWTVTPFLPDFVFQMEENVRRITYLDADLWFLDDPTILIHEMLNEKAAVLLTRHDYAAEYDNPAAGKFCVQFITFDRDNSKEIRKKWQSQCIDWCFARFEDGKFGDQKYLDEWPKNYAKKIYIADAGQALGPWNASRFPVSESIFYHFHQVRFANKNLIHVGNYNIPNNVRKYLYSPYCKTLFEISKQLQNHYDLEISNTRRLFWKNLRSILILLKLKIKPLIISRYIRNKQR